MNEFKPKNILELGLGQSSRLIGQYAKTHKDCRHNIVEHDAGFVEISRKNFDFAANTQINVVDIKKVAINVSDGKGGVLPKSSFTMRKALKKSSQVKNLTSFQ